MKVTANLKTPASGWFRPVLLALAAAPLLLSGAGCGQDDGFAAEPETAAAAPDTRPIVEAAVIASGFLADVLEIAGRLEPRAEVMVSSELGGAVEEVRFDKGDRVERGALLARVGSDLLRAALAEAEAELEGARLDYVQAKQLVEREASPRTRLAGGGSEREAFRGPGRGGAPPPDPFGDHRAGLRSDRPAGHRAW